MGAPLKVAICFAGAWRDWEPSWRYLQRNLVEPLGDVDIYAVSDSLRAGAHGRGDPEVSVERMRATFGPRFKDGIHLSA